MADIECYAKVQARGMEAVIYFTVELEDGESPADFSQREWDDIVREGAEQAVYDLFTVNEIPDVEEYDRV
jgi:hypothetical protein